MKAIKRQKAGRLIFFYEKFDFFNLFTRWKKKTTGYMFIALFLLPFSPFFSLLFFFYGLVVFYKRIATHFFPSKEYVVFYNKLMKNMTADRVVSVIGYEVYEGELGEHLDIVSSDAKEAAERLRSKEMAMKSYKNVHRHVGIDFKFLTTHTLMTGMTGAGKTEGIRSLVNDILKAGGGVNFTDGKSDTKMLGEFYSQAKRLGRDTSRFAINFLQPENLGESNTMSILNMLHPVKIIEFLGSLVKKDESGGDANFEHFFQKGKSMLFPITSCLYIRNKFYREGINFDKLEAYQTPVNMTILYVTFYSMLRDINDKIKNDTYKLSAELESMVGVIAENKDLEYVEKTIELVTQYTSKAAMVEEELGFSYVVLKEIYQNSFSILQTYLSTIWNRYSVYLPILAKIIYAVGQKNGKKFFEYGNFDNCYNINEIKEFFRIVKDEISTDDKHILEDFLKKYSLQDYDLGLKDLMTLMRGLTTKNGSVDDPPPDAVQQHAYAQQIWTNLFQLLSVYKHIFGANEGDVQPIDLLRNNKFLYTLIPPLSLQRSQTEILGKIQVMALKEVASLALGGEKLSLHPTLENIYKDKFTPKPFYLFILDEYGAYPVDGIDVILAQVRSLNIGVIISVQDFVSLKTSGTNETAQKRALANLNKVFYKTEDKDVIEWLEHMVSKINVQEAEFSQDEEGNLIEMAKVGIKEASVFEPRMLREFDKGFAALQRNGDAGGTVFLHTFYRGGKQEEKTVKHYVPYDAAI